MGRGRLRRVQYLRDRSRHLGYRRPNLTIEGRARNDGSALDGMRMTETGKNYWALRVSFWCVGVVLGAADAWAARFTMNADGISYLDIGDAYWRRDWHMAINAYWSPLYSWILGLFLKVLKPSAYWEYPLVRVVNFLIYVTALACFEFFLSNFIRDRRESGRASDGAAELSLPEWAWWALGYSLFIWTSLVLITIGVVTPDMCVAGFVYLACGLLLQIRAKAATQKAFVLLGVVLGFGYLAKAVMFPLAFVFLAVALFSMGSLRQASARVVVSVFVFFVIAAPFMVAISRAKGRFTLGETGRLNYAGCINGVDFWFPGDSGAMKCLGDVSIEGVDEIESPSSKELLHPVRRIFDRPATYQFDGPIGGTYPFWYDPSYWQEGIKPRFDLRGQAWAAMRGIRSYGWICLHAFRYVTLGLCIIYLLARKRSLCIKRAAANWPLVVPGLSGLGLYAFVFVENRYIAPFVLLLWLAAFSGVRIPGSQVSKWLIAVVSVGIAATLVASAGTQVGQHLATARSAAPVYWQAATGLRKLGIRSGDKVAVVVKWPMGESVPFVARLARAQIVAQVNRPDHFFAAPPSAQSQVLQALAAHGAKAFLTEAEPPPEPPDIRWEALGPTNFYVCLLDKARQ